MHITMYTTGLSPDRELGLVRRCTTGRPSLWDRFRVLAGKGFSRRRVASPTPTDFPVTLDLAGGEVVWICSNVGVGLECHSGVLWVTRGDGQDLVLTAGESLTVHKDERALVHALQDAWFTIRPDTGSHAPAAGSSRMRVHTAMRPSRPRLAAP